MAMQFDINTVLREYKMRTDTFQVKRENILAELFKKYPRLGNLRKEYAAMRINEHLHKNDSAYIKKYKNLYKEFDAFLIDCLNEEGLSKKDIEYFPLCPICKDTGYVGTTRKKHCSCVVSKAAQGMLEGSNINKIETIKNFDLGVFDTNQIVSDGMTQRDFMKKLFDHILSWINAFPKSKKSQIIIRGNVGLGKSYCLNAIAYEVLSKGFSAMMITSFAINEAAFDEIKKSDASALNTMRSVDLLLIDDLGSEQVLKNITQPTLFNVLNERIRRNLNTVVSTNLSAEQIEARYGSRVHSRLIDKNRTAIFTLSGKDIRKL